MRFVPSHEFRTSYHRLTERVVVTVMGRPIGVWEPWIIRPEIMGIDSSDMVKDTPSVSISTEEHRDT